MVATAYKNRLERSFKQITIFGELEKLKLKLQDSEETQISDFKELAKEMRVLVGGGYVHVQHHCVKLKETLIQTAIKTLLSWDAKVHLFLRLGWSDPKSLFSQLPEELIPLTTNIFIANNVLLILMFELS